MIKSYSIFVKLVLIISLTMGILSFCTIQKHRIHKRDYIIAKQVRLIDEYKRSDKILNETIITQNRAIDQISIEFQEQYEEYKKKPKKVFIKEKSNDCKGIKHILDSISNGKYDSML